jgi:hypothetical protein
MRWLGTAVVGLPYRYTFVGYPRRDGHGCRAFVTRDDSRRVCNAADSGPDA